MKMWHCKKQGPSPKGRSPEILGAKIDNLKLKYVQQLGTVHCLVSRFL